MLQKKNHYKYHFAHRLSFSYFLGFLILMLLVVSGVAASFLLNQNQDIRQQASTTDTTGGVYGVKNCSFGVADGAYYCDAASKSIIRKCDNGTLSIVKSCAAGTECSTSGSCKAVATASPTTSPVKVTDGICSETGSVTGCTSGTGYTNSSCRTQFMCGSLQVQVDPEKIIGCTTALAIENVSCGNVGQRPCKCSTNNSICDRTDLIVLAGVCATQVSCPTATYIDQATCGRNNTQGCIQGSNSCWSPKPITTCPTGTYIDKTFCQSSGTVCNDESISGLTCWRRTAIPLPVECPSGTYAQESICKGINPQGCDKKANTCWSPKQANIGCAEGQVSPASGCKFWIIE